MIVIFSFFTYTPLFYQEERWLEVCADEIKTVIDLKQMLETDLITGKTCFIQRVEKVSNIGIY